MISMAVILMYGGIAIFNVLSPLELFAASTWVLLGIIVATIWFEIETNLLAQLLAWVVGRVFARFIQDENSWLSWIFIIERRK
jgi:hypothetical protein